MSLKNGLISSKRLKEVSKMLQDLTRSLVSNCRKIMILRLWSGHQEQNTCAFSENSITGSAESMSALKTTLVVSSVSSKRILMEAQKFLIALSIRFRSREPTTAGWTETQLGPLCRFRRETVISTACSGTQRRSSCGLTQTVSTPAMTVLEFTSPMLVWRRKRVKLVHMLSTPNTSFQELKRQDILTFSSWLSRNMPTMVVLDIT